MTPLTLHDCLVNADVLTPIGPGVIQGAYSASEIAVRLRTSAVVPAADGGQAG